MDHHTVTPALLAAKELLGSFLKLFILDGIYNGVEAGVTEDGYHSEVVERTIEVQMWISQVKQQEKHLVPDPAHHKTS